MADAKQKGMTVRLVGGDGSQLKVGMRFYKLTGQFTSSVVHSTAKNGEGKRTHQRGASQTHPSREKAIEAVNALVAVAVQKGWIKPAGANGFEPKPDAFDVAHLPTAPKTAVT